MVRSSLALVALAACAVQAVSIPRDEINLMKRNYIDSLSKRSKLAKRQSVTSGVGDADILNFALTLEHLEAAFYGQALQNFTADDFSKAGFTGVYPLLQQVSADESQHVSFLTSALSAAGATPVEACEYTFPYTDVASFLAVSQILEGVGTSAYLGAAGAINTSAYVTAAGSILTVEARHAAFISYLNGYSPFPAPEDTPQSAASVVTLASPFFKSCPTGSAPAIAGKPALTVTTTMPKVGSSLSIAPMNASAVSSSGTLYCGFASGLGAGFSKWSNGTCMIPTSNVTDGQTYVTLTTGPSVSDDSVVAGPAVIILGANNYTISAKMGSTTNSSGSASGVSSGSMPSGTSAPASGANMLQASGALAALAGAVALLL
ncbi:ferritin-like domain-domain-containing protein [Leucosporidium creatinivorum]|uniref:Ferritin-like domain-domain-containing protein n=1 Tax=Leucosporidium creatinivorum TaxID=106004 RepID=A0A1Y2FND1_9BASI|nr:ferritin-like domain-domain-containing protein [Leucosporidium creatinivorum]